MTTTPVENSLQLSSNFDDLFPAEISAVAEQNILPEPPKNALEDFKEESPKVDEKKVEEVAPPKVKSESNTKHREKLRELIAEGIIEDFAVDVTDKDGEKTQVFASELKEVDKDLYKTLIDAYNKAKKDSIDEKYISRDGLDEFTEKIIEAKKAGGSVAEAIQPNIRAVEQISDIKERLNNADAEEAQQIAINIVAQDLQRKGLSERVIHAQIKDYVETFEIDAIANQILDAGLESHKEEINNKHQEELARVAKQKEEQKQFRASLIAEYKEIGVKDESLRKVLVDNATNQDSQSITNTDKLYFEASKDPKKFALINYALNNIKSFEEFISHGKVLANKAQNLKSVITVNLGTVKTKAPSSSKDSVDEMFEMLKT